MKKNHTSFSTKLILINSLNIIIILIFITCQFTRKDSDSLSAGKIWSNEVLSIEFINNDTISFYSDTLPGSEKKILIFSLKEDFTKSKLLNIDKHLKSWFTPLHINVDQFIIYLEVKKVSNNWFLVKNGEAKSFLWISGKECDQCEIIALHDFLTGLKTLDPLKGPLSECLRVSPSDHASKIRSKAIDCIVVTRVVKDNWLEVRFKTHCQVDTIEKVGFLKWKDQKNNLLIRL